MCPATPDAHNHPMEKGRIRVVVADDSPIVREGVSAIIAAQPELEVVGAAADYDELLEQVDQLQPDAVVTDIRMPPTFHREGIEAARIIRRRHPGTAVVVLSQHDDPDYVISLLKDGAEGYAYLLKDRVASSDELTRAVLEASLGRTWLDPKVVEKLTGPAAQSVDLTPSEHRLLQMIAEGRTIKAMAAAEKTTPGAVAQAVEDLFLKLAELASSGVSEALESLKQLHRIIVKHEEEARSLSRMVPTGVAEKLREKGWKLGQPESADVTVLVGDIRGFSSIAEANTPASLALQLGSFRAAMTDLVHRAGGSVMDFAGDGLMAVFGSPILHADHARRAVGAAAEMHLAQWDLNERWAEAGLPEFPLGIGISSGEVAATLIGSEERYEYSLIGDTVNLAHRLQQWAQGGETVLSENTYSAVAGAVEAARLEPAPVKGRKSPVVAYKVAAP